MRRPALVTWSAAAVLILAAVFIMRALASLQLPELPLSVPPAYLTVTGIAWGASGATVGVALLAGRAWAVTALRWGLPAFLIWYWVDRLLFARSEYAAQSWPFAVVVSALGLAWVVFVSRHSSFKKFFEESTDD